MFVCVFLVFHLSTSAPVNQHVCFKGLTDTTPPESLEIESKPSSRLAVFIQLGLNNVLYMYIYVYEAIHKIQDLSFGNSGVPTIINTP